MLNVNLKKFANIKADVASSFQNFFKCIRIHLSAFWERCLSDSATQLFKKTTRKKEVLKTG